MTGAFERNYTEKCLRAYRYESFTVTYTKREYHYILYYYDQAGNLIRTIPPAGVHPADTAQVKLDRQGGTELLPAHTLVTDYRYNTLNQVVAQHTPDGGTSAFWYDRLGRLSVSQNAKQKDSTQYSYTKYDIIGRITEVGQLVSSTAMADATSRSQASLDNWLTNAAGTVEQITKTTYDEEYTPLQPVLKTRNLRNRVSWTALFNNAADLAGNNFATASFYTYDILGNVDTLLQDYKLGIMADNSNRFKKIAYDFDLVSGKVNQVSYQPGQPDAFYHRYVYDAENRITHVLTSADSINWDNDAFYQYYDHGPLARAVLGEQQVQGVNYGYSLQGWMKSINPDIYNGTGYTLKADGSTGSIVGKTAYNIMLNYFNGDYTAISGATPQDASVNTSLGSDYRPLYNGNISSMAVNIEKLNNPLFYNYQYDQLNRLVAMDAWQKTGSSWSNITKLSDFQERVSYDANGNIQGYKRNGNNTFAGKPLGMDSLTYKYVMGTNRLDHVNDTVPAGNYDVDIDNQSAGNYAYDSIGNLVKDNAEGITSISWTVYGKISRIVKGDGTNISYTYDAGGNRISKTVIKSASTDTARTWYVRDGQGNVMSVYVSGNDSVNDGHLTQTELHLYGSSRVGLLKRSLDVAEEYNPADTTMPLLGTGYSLTFGRGNKLFELSNHLGNVLVTVNDKKLGVSTDNSIVDYFNPQVVSAQDYYPFGMLQPGRVFNTSGYRYGFNGKENDNEVKGEGNQLDFGARIYDPRLGRFLSTDPLTKNYPWYTPYQFAGNNPIKYIDVEGYGTGDPGVPLGIRVAIALEGNFLAKKKFILESAKIHGITKPYETLTRIGRIFEDAALRSLGLENKKQKINPYPERPDKYFIPDAIEDYKVTTENTSYVFKNAFITDVKFSTGSELKLEPNYNPEQIRGFIDYLSEVRGVEINGVPTNDKISDYGAAALILVTPSDLSISDDLINYAKSKNVALLKRVPVAVTSFFFKEDQNEETDAMKNNKIKFTKAYVISPSENKKVDSDLYKAQAAGEEQAGSNYFGKGVIVDWEKK